MEGDDVLLPNSNGVIGDKVRVRARGCGDGESDEGVVLVPNSREVDGDELSAKAKG